MVKIAFISGANRGLGKALADQILKLDNTKVVSVSRSIHPDQINLNPSKFLFIKADLSMTFLTESFKSIEQLITPETKIIFFNNAGIIAPIEKVGNFSQENILHSISVNISFPVSFINYLIHSFKDNKILFINISSGAANRAISNWALYSSAKAYLKMFFEILKTDYKGHLNFSFYNIDPGTMNTGMQAEIRMSNSPDQNYFENLKSSNLLTEPEDAAKKILQEINFLQ